MAHLAASWPDQVLCKENKRKALEAQHKSWMCQRDKALREQPTATASNATAPDPHESSHEDDELHEELQEITAFLDGVGCAIENNNPRTAASAGDDDGDEEASSFVDSDEEVDDAAFARYAAARRRQLSSAVGDSGDGRAVGDDDAETSWATLGAAARGAKRPSWRCLSAAPAAPQGAPGSACVARHSQRGRSGQWAPSHGLGCSAAASPKSLPPKSPIPPPPLRPPRCSDLGGRGDEPAALLAPPRQPGGFYLPNQAVIHVSLVATPRVYTDYRTSL